MSAFLEAKKTLGLEVQLEDGFITSDSRQLSFSALFQIPRACRTRWRWVHSKVCPICRLFGVKFDSAFIKHGNGFINH